MKLTTSINYWRADPTGWIGAAIMLGFAGIAGQRWYESGLIFYALTFLRDVAASWFFISRNEDSSRRKFGWHDVLAYISCAMPLVYLSPLEETSIALFAISNILAIFGFSLSTLALFELGKSFGVSPANRGKVTSGVYKLFRHPMYVGYGVAEIGLIFLNPLNAVIFLISASLYGLRSNRENKIVMTDTSNTETQFIIEENPIWDDKKNQLIKQESEKCFELRDIEIGRALPRNQVWGRLELSASNEVLGYGWLDILDEEASAELSLAVAMNHQGKKIGPKILKELIRIGNNRHLDSVIATVKPENIKRDKLLRILQAEGFYACGSLSESEIQKFCNSLWARRNSVIFEKQLV